MSSTREYVREMRVVEKRSPITRVLEGEFVVHAYSILGTDEVVFDVLEPYRYEGGCASHSTSGHYEIDPEGNVQSLGHVRTRKLTSDLAALAYGPARTAAALAFYRANEAVCEEVIRAAYPDLFAHYGAGRIKDGHGYCTLDEYAAAA